MASPPPVGSEARSRDVARPVPQAVPTDGTENLRRGRPRSGCALDIGEGIVAGLLVLVVVLVAIFVLIPLVVALVEIVGLALIAVAVLASRVLLRRPWVIEAATGDESRYEWRVVGWRASGATVASLARHLQAGLDPDSFEPR